MIKLFRKIRQKSLTESKFSKYLLYAIGEIVLVVIGILIALSINNNNEARKVKVEELNYLHGVKSDLQLNLTELKIYNAAREKSVNSAEIILDCFEEIKILSPDEFNFHNLNVQIWYPFNENNNIFQELINSGKFAIISNDSIKKMLLNMQLEYRKINFLEGHLRYDFDNYIYPIYFGTTDLKSDIANYTFQVTNGAEGIRTELSEAKIKSLLNNQLLKNGFVLSIFSNNLLVIEYNNMIVLTEKLIDTIESELEKNK